MSCEAVIVASASAGGSGPGAADPAVSPAAGAPRRSGLSDAPRGSGLFGTLMGFTVFMLLLITAVQVLFNLYATTVVTGAAFDAARTVAGYDSVADRCAATAGAEAALLTRLGGYTERGTVTLAWTCNDPEAVRLAVLADHPTILPRRMRALTGLGRMERTIEVRVEDLR